MRKALLVMCLVSVCSVFLFLSNIANAGNNRLKREMPDMTPRQQLTHMAPIETERFCLTPTPKFITENRCLRNYLDDPYCCNKDGEERLVCLKHSMNLLCLTCFLTAERADTLSYGFMQKKKLVDTIITNPGDHTPSILSLKCAKANNYAAYAWGTYEDCESWRNSLNEINTHASGPTLNVILDRIRNYVLIPFERTYKGIAKLSEELKEYPKSLDDNASK